MKTNKKLPGPSKNIKKHQGLAIKRFISKCNLKNEKVNSTNILKNINLNVSISTVQRYLASKQIVYTKAAQSIQLTDIQKQKRVDCATTWLAENLNWDTVIFSDEKKFSCDGPDNWMSYHSKSYPIIRQKRQMGGGSVMVWCMTFPTGQIFLKVLKGVQKSVNYLSLLSNFAVPIIKDSMGDNFDFQHDNCSIHTSKIIKTFFIDSEIKVLEWPSKSPDINIVENVWKMLSEIVYNGPQLKNAKELEQ